MNLNIVPNFSSFSEIFSSKFCQFCFCFDSFIFYFYYCYRFLHYATNLALSLTVCFVQKRDNLARFYVHKFVFLKSFSLQMTTTFYQLQNFLITVFQIIYLYLSDAIFYSFCKLYEVKNIINQSTCYNKPYKSSVHKPVPDKLNKQFPESSSSRNRLV